MKKDRDAAEQKNAEQLEKLLKNCQNHDDDETTRSKLFVDFETTTSEVVLQKQQLSVQNESMNKVKQGDTEQQMSDKEADENDEDVEVCKTGYADASNGQTILGEIAIASNDTESKNCHKQGNTGNVM